MRKILVLAHREELIYQAVGHARNAGLVAGIEMGSHRAFGENVIVSSVQTQVAWSKCTACVGAGCDLCDNRGKRRRLERFDPVDFGLVIIDEGHHATAKSYRAVLDHYTQNSDLKVLLVTATPKRSDGIGLHNVCDSVAYEMDIRAAIDDGWLVPIRQRFVTVDGLDLSQVRTRNGDLADGELEKAFLGETDVEEEKLLHAIAKPSLDEAGGRPLLVFAAGVAHAEKLTAAFNAYAGVTAELVVGTTDRDERKRRVERYKRRDTQVLVGVGVFTEGFDAPGTHAVAIARPTKSESLYSQMIGRATRPLPGIVDGPETAQERRAAIDASDKPHCIVLDFCGNSGTHKLVSVVDLLAGDDVVDVDVAAAVEDAKRAGRAVDMQEVVEQVKEARERREARAREEAALRDRTTRHYAERVDYTAVDVDPFGDSRFDPLADYKPAPWDATPNQIRFLCKLGVPLEKARTFSKNQAGAVIDGMLRATGGDAVMTFGKHKGKRLRDVPDGYVQWMEREGIGGAKWQANIRTMQEERVTA